ncbi:MAG TPA: isoaspartyl peptidase/L-asparaginase [Candidatus Polarisedimenticolaceae bacterium]
MAERIRRREFLRAGATAGVAAMLPRGALGQAPAVVRPKTARPAVVASANGHEFTNGGPRTCVQEAWERIVRGEDPLDALVAGVEIVELDPLDDSVGFGGLPNADGVVQLDACVMHGPKRRAGAVAALEGVRTAARVARAVADHTDHHLLVGRGAQEFARGMGFRIEDDLNTENSRRKWLEWKRRIDPGHWLDPDRRERAAAAARREMIAAGRLDPEKAWGTIHASAVTSAGALASVTTTSGLAWKIPGRVGDSPILGAGNYCADGVGAAGSTGRGEANLFSLGSFWIVEQLRLGSHPKDAVMAALRRVREGIAEKRLLDARGLPGFDVKFYALDAGGRFAAGSLYRGPRARFAVCDADGPRFVPTEPLLDQEILTQ